MTVTNFFYSIKFTETVNPFRARFKSTTFHIMLLVHCDQSMLRNVVDLYIFSQ